MVHATTALLAVGHGRMVFVPSFMCLVLTLALGVNATDKSAVFQLVVVCFSNSSSDGGRGNE